jgi:uncharacterized protein
MNWTHTLRSRTQQQLEQAVQVFNQGQFYEAHEGFEKLWRNADAEERQFFQGLVQVAVAFHFRSEHNLAGALGMLDLATRNLAAYAGECHGLQLTALLCMLSAWRSALLQQSTVSYSPRIEVHRGVNEMTSQDAGGIAGTANSFPRPLPGKVGLTTNRFAVTQYYGYDIRLAVWYSRTAVSSSKAAAFYEDLLDEKRVPLGEEVQVYAFYNELCSRYPENEMLGEEALEDSPWCCAHERSGIHVLMTVRQEQSAETIPVILELAQKNGLVCFDPQSKMVLLPAELGPISSRLTAR